KAGKSSLLNALFGREFAKTGVLPATDRVCIFRYGEVEKTVDVSPQLIERYLPIDFLRDFNVVDTPGTNTMVEEHQRITEEFVPRADLVFFVFSVVNPWTQSAWDLLAFVQKRWLKNIVFVLQQIASEVREAFRTIRQDEERFERLMHFLQARKEQTLRQVHGFVRGVEQACRDCAVQGTSFLESKLTFWTTVNMIWRRDYWQ